MGQPFDYCLQFAIDRHAAGFAFKATIEGRNHQNDPYGYKLGDCYMCNEAELASPKKQNPNLEHGVGQNPNWGIYAATSMSKYWIAFNIFEFFNYTLL